MFWLAIILLFVQPVAATCEVTQVPTPAVSDNSSQPGLEDKRYRPLLVSTCCLHFVNITSSTAVGIYPQLCFEHFGGTALYGSPSPDTDSSLERLMFTICLYLVMGFMFRESPVRDLTSAAMHMHKRCKCRRKRLPKPFPKFRYALPRIVFAARCAGKRRLAKARLRIRRKASHFRFVRQQFRHGRLVPGWHSTALAIKDLRRTDFLIPGTCQHNTAAQVSKCRRKRLLKPFSILRSALPRIPCAGRRRLAKARLRTRRKTSHFRFARPQFRHAETCQHSTTAQEQASYLHHVCANRHEWAGGGGGGAAAATKRKRLEREQSSQKGADNSLAMMLMSALHSWQGQQARNEWQSDWSAGGADDWQQEDWTRPPKQTRRSSGESNQAENQAQTQASSSLAQRLSGVLQQSIKQGHSDAQVASKLIRMLKPYLPQPSQEENSGGNPAPKTPGSRSTPQTRVVVANTEVSIVTAEWANKPICMQAQAALDAIQSGTPLAGNLVVVRDANQATQISTYYSTHALTECITLLLPGPAPKDAGFSQAFARIGLGKGQISTQAIALRALGDWSKCPWPLPSTQVDTTKVPIVKRCTLRIVAPSEYRHLHLQKGQDNAQQILCDMAAWEPQIPASKLGGGQWTWQTSSKGPRSDNMLVGFLKLPLSEAEKLIAHSGQKGIFLNILDDPGTRREMHWFPAAEGETRESYFRRALHEASGKPLLYRKGGSNNLGTLLAQDQVNKPKALTLVMTGMPSAWEEEEVFAFLELQKWKNIKVVTRQIRKQRPQWIVSAEPPSLSDARFWVYEDAQTSTSICLAPAPPRRHSFQSEPAWAPKKGWHFQKQAVDAPPKQEREGRTARKQESKSEERERTRSRERARTEVDNRSASVEATQLDADMQSEAEPSSTKPNPPNASKANHDSVPSNPDEAKLAGWVEHDKGGDGDCFYRAFCAAVHSMENPGKQLKDDELKRLAADARAQVVLHVKRHQDKFRPHYALDPNETPEMRSNQPPADTLDKWMHNQSLPSTWACGLTIQAMVEVTGLPAIVWKLKGGIWERYTLAGKFKDGKITAKKGGSPVVLILRNRHFTFLAPNNTAGRVVSLPRPWLLKTQKPHEIIDLTGAGKRSCSKGTNSARSVKTPSLHSLRTTRSRATPSLHTVHSAALDFPPVATESTGSKRCCSSDFGDAGKHSKQKTQVQTPETKVTETSPSHSGPRKAQRVQNCLRVPAKRCSPVSAPIAASQGGRTKWWECDCGFVVYKHPIIKSHHERRKLHLHKVHGVPWADIPPPPKPSHSASSAATQKAFEGRWQILWTKFNANRWPGAHDIVAESIGHPPKHRCKACQRLVKRSDVVSEVCTKHRFRSQVPALKARRKLWGSWSKAARKEAAKQRGEARKAQRVADTRKAKVDSSQAFRALSTAGTSIDKPVMQIGLPLVKSSNHNTGNWWKCKYCEFAIPASSPSHGRSSIKSRHLWNMHGLRNEPLPRGGLETLPARIANAQETYQRRWSLIWQAYAAASWVGAHQVAETPALFRIFTSKTGHQWSQPMHQCTACSMLVARNRLPVEVCPAYKGNCKPTSSAKRKREWKTFRKEASKSTRRTPQRKRKQPTS